MSWIVVFNVVAYVSLFSFQKCFEMLLANGANASKRDMFSNSPLSFAARENKVRFLELLYKYGTNLSMRIKLHETTLHCAAWHGHLEMLRKLLAYGMTPNVYNSAGQTPLSLAVRTNHYMCGVALLESGSSICSLSQEGEMIPVSLRPRREEENETLTRDAYAVLHASGCRSSNHVYDNDVSLFILCHKFIRNYLINLHKETNLFWIIPKLPLPKVMKNDLLFYTSIT